MGGGGGATTAITRPEEVEQPLPITADQGLGVYRFVIRPGLTEQR